jgi:hypothetical protein
MKATLITVHEDGSMSCLKTELIDAMLTNLGPSRQRRVSHIWPVNPVKRIGFRALRALCGERGRVSEWCRSWRGPWEVRFVDSLNHRRIGAVVFSHPSRRVCLEWEIEQLNGKV